MTKTKILDIAERAGWTYVQAFVGFLIASEIWTAVDRIGVLKGAAGAALPAALAVIKGAVAGLFGNKATASTLPASVDPAT